jgi:PAS domain S-box-containing protein
LPPGTTGAGEYLSSKGMNPAERLRAAKNLLLRSWAERARERLPPARQNDSLALVDALPQFIDQLVIVLASQSPREALDRMESALAVEHGRDRAMQPGWSLSEVLSEYQLLRQILFEVLEAEGPLAREERDVILDGIQLAVRNAVSEFDRLRTAEREARIAFGEQRFAQFVEAVKDYAIFTVDPRGLITSWNAGAERMKQYTPEEAVGSHFSMLYPEEGRRRDEPMGHLKSAAIEGRFRGEGVRVRKNGEHFLADVSITPIYGDGELRGFAKVVQDLTERNVLMQELDLSRGEAERLRIEAEYRERFVQHLTHDLRSPLSAAKAAAGLIARAPHEEDKVRTWTQRISDAVDRCDRMITDLLDAARLDAGERISVNLRECDVRRIAEEACDEQRTQHGDRFRIEYEGATRGHWDPQALRRVLDNLLSNAIKYGDRGAPISVAIRRVEDRVHIRVHNQGTIIPVEEQAKLFKPFHRTQEAQATGQRGWGLGLTLVRGIVEGHGGMVKVESYPKEGTTFTVDLPVDPRRQGTPGEGRAQSAG